MERGPSGLDNGQDGPDVEPFAKDESAMPLLSQQVRVSRGQCPGSSGHHSNYCE